MKLHKRTPQQLAAQPEAGAEATGVFEDRESAPSATVGSYEVLAEEQRSCKMPALVEEVIGTLGRVDLFDADSLKALRATCTVFRDLVDATDAVSSAKFDVESRDGCLLLQAWASGSRLTPGTRSLSISSELPKKLAEQVLETLANQKPPIAKLELLTVGAATDSVLTAQLHHLRKLRISSTYPNPPVRIHMVKIAAFTGLQSLSLRRIRDIDASDLAATLAHLRDLQSLQCTQIPLKGSHIDPNVLKNTLTSLETLDVEGCPGIDKLSLLSAQGPALPALRSFKLIQHTLSTGPHWLSHLTKLDLCYVHLPGPGMVAVLSGGPLQELRLDLRLNDWDSSHWDWSGLELAHLTRLEIPLYPGDAMGDVAQAILPSLRSVELRFDHSTIAFSVKAFAAAFQQLDELKLYGIGTQAPHTDALEVLGREIVPRLELLRWHAHVDGNELDACLRSLLPASPAGSAPCWPRL